MPEKMDPKRVAYDDALRAQEARRNRESSPEAAAFVDEVRKHFPGATVTYFGPQRPRFDPRFDSFRD